MRVKNGQWLPVYLFVIFGIIYFSKRARPARTLRTCMNLFHRYSGELLTKSILCISILKYLKWFQYSFFFFFFAVSITPAAHSLSLLIASSCSPQHNKKHLHTCCSKQYTFNNLFYYQSSV